MALTVPRIRGQFSCPVGVGTCRARDPIPPLPPEEAACIRAATAEKRRLHFAMGRACARDALRDLGVPSAIIGKGPQREPVWPPGIVGSITHAADVAVSVVGRTSDYGGIGIDVEPADRRPSLAVLDRVCSQAEQRDLQRAGRDLPAQLLRRLCAKEAVFKAFYMATHDPLGFHDVELTWLPERQAFRARLMRPVGTSYPTGFRFAVACRQWDAWLLASAELPA